jgi:putative Mn2+ efflux pump MntP
MTPLTTALLAFSMSVDAFAAALAKGSALDRPRFVEALRTGAIFGTVETITPLIGWTAGLAAASFIQAIDHWIALILLTLVGTKMISESLGAKTEEKPRQHSFRILVVTAIGTSIDALAVGVMLAFIEANIWITAAAIGAATFTMTMIGIMIGRITGPRLGARAEFIGGVVLILLGVSIFLEHTLGL